LDTGKDPNTITKFNLDIKDRFTNDEYVEIIENCLFNNDIMFKSLSQKKPYIPDLQNFKLEGEFFNILNNDSFKAMLSSFFKEDPEVPEIFNVFCLEINRSYKFQVESRFVELLENKKEFFENKGLVLTRDEGSRRMSYSRPRQDSDDDLFFAKRDIGSQLPTFRPFAPLNLRGDMRFMLGNSRKASNVRFLKNGFNNRRLNMMMMTLGGALFWYKSQ